MAEEDVEGLFEGDEGNGDEEGQEEEVKTVVDEGGITEGDIAGLERMAEEAERMSRQPPKTGAMIQRAMGATPSEGGTSEAASELLTQREIDAVRSGGGDGEGGSGETVNTEPEVKYGFRPERKVGEPRIKSYNLFTFGLDGCMDRETEVGVLDRVFERMRGVECFESGFRRNLLMAGYRDGEGVEWNRAYPINLDKNGKIAKRFSIEAQVSEPRKFERVLRRIFSSVYRKNKSALLDVDVVMQRSMLPYKGVLDKLPLEPCRSYDLGNL